jgi:prophage maintenance system killer protein
MPGHYRINIKKVEKALRKVHQNFDQINDALAMRREPMEEGILANLLEGYRYVNKLLDEGIHLLERQGLHHFLELNHIVMCGTDMQTRIEYTRHVQATTRRFYEQKDFCITDMRNWAQRHRKDSAWKQAAGLYILHISRPQLFLEGNHRTGALLMSSILVSHGKPPFVLTVDNAKAYFDPSSLAQKTKKDIVGKYVKLPKIKKKIAALLKDQADPDLLKSS